MLEMWPNINDSWQRWNPRGHGLGIKEPRGQLTVSLALSSEAKSLPLVLEAKFLLLAVKSLALSMKQFYPY